jgi:hypothetical protein
MLRIEHPAAIVKERDKKLNQWEMAKTTQYKNGVQTELLIGHLPHGAVQSMMQANRGITYTLEGESLIIRFTEEEYPLLDLAAGVRPTQPQANILVLDSCGFLPHMKVKFSNGQQVLSYNGEEELSFEGGEKVSVHAHGHHAHIGVSKNDVDHKAFFNGSDDTLYIFEEQFKI